MQPPSADLLQRINQLHQGAFLCHDSLFGLAGLQLCSSCHAPCKLYAMMDT